MFEAACCPGNSSSSSSSPSSMWQASPQYPFAMPPQRTYDSTPLTPFLYPQFDPQQFQVPSPAPGYAYYHHSPSPVQHQSQCHQQQCQQPSPHQQQHQHQQQQHTKAPPPLPPPLPPLPPPPLPQQQQQPERIDTPNSGVDMTNASNPRASRNAAEKHRRDNLNNQIQAMASLVPAVATGGSRKRDKISVLRLGASFLRMNYTLGQPDIEFLPSRFNNIDLEELVIEHLGLSSSFLLIMTTGGKIIYVSQQVEKLLGHEQTDLMGESLFNYVYDDDKDELSRCLTPDTRALPALRSSSDSLEDSSSSSNSSSDDSAADQPDYRHFRPQRRVFNVRMSARTNSRREAVHYEYTQLSGVLRLASERRLQEQTNGSKSKKSNNATSNDVIFVGIAKLLQKKSVSELTYLVHNRNEYFTRHLVDGRIIFCDHRISVVAGYMAQEVSGTSAFKFMHKDDVRWTIVALRHMYDHGTPYGTSCYRLISKTGQYIYMRTHGYLEIDENSKSVTSFICINTLTSEDEGELLIADMKRRFSATINSTRAIQGTDSGLDSDTECTSTMDEPQKLEQAIQELVTDLPQSRKIEEFCTDSQYVKAVAYSSKMPPAVIHAHQLGIVIPEGGLGKTGKGKGAGKGAGKGSGKGKGKGKHSPSTSISISDSSSECSRRNGSIGEKRIPELEDLSSPVGTDNPASASAEKTFVSPNHSESEYAESGIVEDDSQCTSAPASIDSSGVSVAYSLQNSIVGYLQSDTQCIGNLQQVSLKRPYEDNKDEPVTAKKIATENCVTLELVDINEFVNGEIAFPAYLEVQSGSVGADLQEVPATFQQIDANSITLASKEASFIQLQEYPDELDSSMQNNPEVIKLFTNLPQTITLEGTGEEVNICQYPSSDLRD